MTTMTRSRDYYESMADSFAIEEMAPYPPNQEILSRLKDNDPELVELWLFDIRYGPKDADSYCFKDDDAGDLGWLGYFIRKNTQLKNLRVCCEITEAEESLCKEMAGNQSIRKIELCGTQGSLILELLVPFFQRKESPIHLCKRPSDFYGAQDFPRLLKAMYCCGKSLTGLGLEMLCNAKKYWLDDILGALKAHNLQLEEFRLRSMEIGLTECRKLRALISGSDSCLLKLDLRYNCLDDECISVLAGALTNINQLTHLNISANTTSSHRIALITRRGWESLASLLLHENCNLEELIVDWNQIDDGSALILGNAITTNSKLNMLALGRGDSITLAGWINFTAVIRDSRQLDELWLINANSDYDEGSIVSLAASSSHLFQSSVNTDAFKLSLSYEDYICNEGADTALERLNNDKLCVLDLGRNHLAEPQVWQSLPAMLKNKCPSLEQLHLPGCNIDDNGVDTLMKAVCNSRLNVLDLSTCLSVTSKGWKCIASLMKNPDAQLVEIYLDGNSTISSEEVALYAQSLTTNDMLATLSLTGTSVSRFGWDYFFNVLCDTSSINNTYLSNHTLCNFGGNASINMKRLCALNNGSHGTRFREEEDDNSNSDASDDESYVRCCDKAAVSVVKIVNHHQRFDMSPLFQWDFKVFPVAVKWFDRATSIEMEIEEEERWDVWDADNDDDSSVDDDISVSSDVIRYVLPNAGVVYRHYASEYKTRVQRGKLDAIYQFIRGMPGEFVSLTIASPRRKRKYRKIF